MSSSELRSFTIEESTYKFDGGRYLSKTPGGAAKKAARRIFEDMGSKVKPVKFILRESTSGSAKKTFCYAASKEIYDKPVTVKIGNSEVVYKHKYVVKACSHM